MSNLPEDVIHVTGFGVFRGFTNNNPSWEAVSQLPEYIVHNGQAIAILKHEIPVTYVAVDKIVQEIWSSKPKVSKRGFQLLIDFEIQSKLQLIRLESLTVLLFSSVRFILACHSLRCSFKDW